MQKNKLFFIIPALLFLLYALIQIRYHFFTLDHISWINAFDGDISYQVDRLLLNSHFPNYTQISSTDVDYGVELFLLAPLLKLTNLFTHYNPLYSYYVITTVHLITGLTAIFLLSTFFENNGLEKLLWFTILFLSPLFGFHLSYIKPDPNVVFLLVTLSLYFTSKIKFDLKYAVYALFFAAFGFAIKWWGLFCFLPIFYAMYGIPKIDSNFYVKWAKKALILTLIALIPFTHFLFSEIFFTLRKNNIHNVFTQYSPLILKSLFFLSVSTSLLACFFLLKFSVLRLTKFSKALSIVLLEGIIFLASYLVMALPFVMSGFYLKSFWSYSVGEFKADKIATSERRLVFKNIIFWISELKDYHYLSPILLISFLAVALFFLIGKKKISLNDHFKTIGLYLLGMTFFIFVLLNRNNRALIAMLYPFYLFIIFSLFAKLPKSPLKIAALIGISAAQIVYQANGKGGNLATIYFERDQVRNEVIEANQWLEKNFPHIKNFYMSDYYFPQTLSSPFQFHYKWRYYYKENLEQDFLNQSDTDAWILPTEMPVKYAQEHPHYLDNKKTTRYVQLFAGEKADFTIVENKKTKDSL